MNRFVARTKRLVWFAAAIAAVFVYLSFTHTKEAVEQYAPLPVEKAVVTLSTSTIPLRVSGIVEATNSALISAETNGVISGLFVTEGSVVGAGMLLASQSTPVEDATMVLRQAEADLSGVERSASVDAAENALLQADVVAYSAEEIAALSALTSDNRVADAATGMLVAAESNVTALLDALQFINENKPLFDADTFPVYEAVIADLYGSIPKQFQAPVQRSLRSEADLLAFVRELAAGGQVSVIDTQNLYTLLETQNAALLQMYSGGERDVLDRARVTPNSPLYEEYFAQRTAVIAARKALVTQNAAFSEAIDQAATAAANQDQSVSVSELDAALAKRQAAFSKEIRVAANRVATAASGVAAAQRSLGEVRAPFAGVVAQRLIEVGEYAAAGTPIIQLEGVAGREVEVHIPLVFVSSLKIGDSFVVDGTTVGIVDRFSPVSSGNIVTATVLLSEGSASIGGTISGELMLESVGEVFAVPRSYVHFDTNGAFVMETDPGKPYRASVVYDTGAVLYLTMEEEIPAGPLKPAYSIALP